MTRALNIGGRAETLAFTVNSVCLLEEATGRSFSAALSTDIAGLRALLWCGLIKSRPQLTFDGAGDLIDEYLRGGGDFRSLCGELTAAMEDAGFFPKAKRTG